MFIKKMKKSIPGLACFFLILSCGIEGIPKSVTIKGNPGVYAPLGSPFAGRKDGDRLEDMISPSYIKEMMNRKPVNGQEIEIYEADKGILKDQTIDENTLTYLVQLPVTKLSLNPDNDILKALDEVNTGVKIEIPSISGVTAPTPTNPICIYDYGRNYGPEDLNKPFLKIPLEDMAESIEKIVKGTDDRFGMVINYTQELKDNLELKIPAFNMDWKHGTRSSDNTKLEFFEEGGDFYPATDLKKPAGSGADGEIWVYARISGPCTGVLKLEKILFEWTKAVVNTSSRGPFNTGYIIENGLRDFLGGKIKFKRIDGFVYMSGLKSPNTITMKVDIKPIDLISGTLGNPLASYEGTLEEKELGFQVTGKKFDGTKIIDGSLQDSSFKRNGGGKLDLTPIFEGDGVFLSVETIINTLEVERSSGFNSDSVQFSLYALIPLDLKVQGEDAPDVVVDSVNLKQQYVILELGDEPGELKAGTGYDLFGREEGGDNLFEDIEYVEISLRDIDDITIIDKANLAVLINNKKNDKNDYRLLNFTDNTSLKFTGESLGIPFNPYYSILLKKKPGDNYGSLTFLRSDNPSFDFKIDVRAKARFEHTINF
jgi:hypothetical protein